LTYFESAAILASSLKRQVSRARQRSEARVPRPRENEKGVVMVRAVASVFGVSFLAVGLLGFVLNPTGGELLGIFAVNVLHNLVHLLFGIFGIAAVLVGRSRIYLQGVGVIYLLLTVLGFVPGLFVGDECCSAWST
jgi:hypothetical protein